MISLKGRSYGDSVPKTIFGVPVSCQHVCVVAFTFCSFDVFSLIAAPVLYLNLSGIR
jgi:hypothetical protein